METGNRCFHTLEKVELIFSAQTQQNNLKYKSFLCKKKIFKFRISHDANNTTYQKYEIKQ